LADSPAYGAEMLTSGRVTHPHSVEERIGDNALIEAGSPVGEQLLSVRYSRSPLHGKWSNDSEADPSLPIRFQLVHWGVGAMDRLFQDS
jgi:hypothetical protein